MEFFFPDSQDQVDPTFDFDGEISSPDRVRQRDDRYAHEVLNRAPYEGILLSKALVDGPGSKYTFAQRQRLYRLGVRDFFRLNKGRADSIRTLGDCGAFNYVRMDAPPFTVEDVLDFYEECCFDLGVSVDHLIFGYIPEQPGAKSPRLPEPVWTTRQEMTLDLAADFLRLHKARKASFEPLGVAQGWSPSSYARAVKRLQKIGYRYIALGGMVPLKTPDILACLKAIADVREPTTYFHLLGVSRTDHVNVFESFHVRSFDSTSPFRQAFKDERDNYYTPERKYVAIRVMQIDSNSRLKRRVLAGELDQRHGRELQDACLASLKAYDEGECSADLPLSALAAYDEFLGERAKHRKWRAEEYRRTLVDAPWRSCRCGICEGSKINVVIFRGTERNKRRGFHNLSVFNHMLHKELRLAS